MDTERMKRVLERVYGPVAPPAAGETPDALRECLRLETEAAVLLRYLVRASRACLNPLGEPLRRIVLLSRARQRLYGRTGETALPLTPETARRFAAECHAEESAAVRLLALAMK